MKKLRLLILLAIILGMPRILFGQTTTVTGTVVDANSNAYFPGTISAYIVLNSGQALPAGVPASGSIGPNATTTGGNFSITVASPFTWQFTICGVPKSIGPLVNPTPTQVCFSTAPIAISGASQSITSSLPTIPLLGPGGGGGVTTPTPGSLVSFGATVSPLAYAPCIPVAGVSPCLLKYVTDVQWNNTTSTISFPNADGPFGADAGKNMFGTSAPTAVIGPCTGTACGQQSIPLGIIISANGVSATVSTTTTNACTASASSACDFAWYAQDATAALNSAAQAAWNNGQQCLAVELPGFAMGFSAQIFNVTSSTGGNPCGNSTANGSQSDAIQVGPMVYGQGASISTLVPLPNFTFSNPVIGGTPQAQYHDFGVNGLGQALAGTTHAVNLFQAIAVFSACTGSTIYNMVFSGWGMQSTGTVGVNYTGGCGDPVGFNVISEMFGETSCSVTSNGALYNPIVIIAWACFGSANGNGSFQWSNSGGSLTTIGNYFLGAMTQTGFSVAVTAGGSGGGTWNSIGDTIGTQFASSGQTLTIFVTNGATGAMNLINDQVSIASGAPSASKLILMQPPGTGGFTMRARDTQFVGTGANNAFMQMSTNTTFIDEGNNTVTPGSAASTMPSGSFFIADNKLRGTCTGVATASQSTMGLYGTGPNVTATTCTATTPGSGVTVQGPRTAFGLFVAAGAGGVNASSGAFTVLRNGVATAITCTVGTGTVCNDFTHTVSFSDGDLISIQFTTQAAETLAGIKAIVDWN